jgi:hypothetical protein
MTRVFKRDNDAIRIGRSAYLAAKQYCLYVRAVFGRKLKSRWSPLTLWAAAMVSLGCFLYASHCKQVQIDIVATSDSLAFKISDIDVDWPPIKVTSLEVITSAQIDGDIGTPPNAPAAFNPIAFEGAGGVLDLQPFKLKQSDTLSIRHLSGSDNLFEFVVSPDPIKNPASKVSYGGPTELTLIIFGTARLDTAGSKPRILTSDHPISVKISMRDSERVFRVKLAESAVVQTKPFQVSGISFFDTIEQSQPTPFSTIKDGSIRFEDVVVSSGNKEKQLRAGEPLRIGTLENGYIRTVRLSDKGIYMGYFGDVLGLESIWGNYRTGKFYMSNLMPTRFEWWASDPAVVAYATLIAAIVGVIAAGMALTDRK